MSYTLVIVRPPVPDNDAEAWRHLEKLGESSAASETPAVFHALIDRLTMRHPCICDLPDDAVDDGVWSDGPLRNNARSATTVLGISAPHVETVGPFVVETALALGLFVFDEQEGRILRPGPDGAAAAAPLLKKPWWKVWT